MRAFGRTVSTTGALVIFVLVALGPIVAPMTAQPKSRFALTAAIAEHGTVDTAGYPVGIDRALYEGRPRSDKAIGQPLLAVPGYLVGRAFGAESAAQLRREGNLGLWWSTLWSSIVPFAVLLALMYRIARRYAPDHALHATLALGFGTMMLPHAVNLYGHILAALCAFAAYAVVDREDLTPLHLVAAGLLAGSAVAVEYHAVIAAVVVFAVIAGRVRWRAGWAAAGMVPPALVVAGYQWRAFGAWYRTPFAFYAGAINGTTDGGYRVPGLPGFMHVFAGTRGLLWVAPVTLLALGFAVRLARTAEGALRRHAVVALAIAAAYVLLCAGWSGTPLLEEPGPRYAIPALPFLVVPLAAGWKWMPRLTALASAFGACLMALATYTFILLPTGATPVNYVMYALRGDFELTLFSLAFGPAGVVLHVALIIGGGWLLWRAAHRSVTPAHAVTAGELTLAS